MGLISSSFLLPSVFELYELNQPDWFHFLNDVKNICPGKSLNVVLHKNGTYSSTMTELEEEAYRKYELLQYDYLYGKQYGKDILK